MQKTEERRKQWREILTAEEAWEREVGGPEKTNRQTDREQGESTGVGVIKLIVGACDANLFMHDSDDDT